MPAIRHNGKLNGLHPGSPDLPSPRRTNDELRDEAAKQTHRDAEARAGNRAYGTLDLGVWTESMTRAPKAIPPPRLGRPKKGNR